MVSGASLFRVMILVVVVPLLAFNAFTLIGGNLLSVIPILLQVPLVVALLTGSRRQAFFAKLWSGFLVLGGVAGLLDALANLGLRNLHSSDTDYSTFAPRELVFNALALAFGVYVFARSKAHLSPRRVEAHEVVQA